LAGRISVLDPQTAKRFSLDRNVIDAVGADSWFLGSDVLFTSSVGSLALVNGGVGCMSISGNLSFVGGQGSGWYTVSAGSISSVTLISGGSGFSSAPQVVVSDPACKGYLIRSVLSDSALAGSVRISKFLDIYAGGTFIAMNPVLPNIPSATTNYRIRSPISGAIDGFVTAAPENTQVFINLDSSATSMFYTDPRYLGSTVSISTSVSRIDLSGSLSAVTILNAGSGCENRSGNLVFSGGGGTGAAGTYISGGGRLISVTLTSGGTRYTSDPNVVADGLTCQIQLNVSRTVGGIGCTQPSGLLSLIGGGGSGATGVYSADCSTGNIISVTLTSTGNGYLAAPNVYVSDPGCKFFSLEAILADPQAAGISRPSLSYTWSDCGVQVKTTTAFQSYPLPGSQYTILPGTWGPYFFTNSNRGFPSTVSLCGLQTALLPPSQQTLFIKFPISYGSSNLSGFVQSSMQANVSMFYLDGGASGDPSQYSSSTLTLFGSVDSVVVGSGLSVRSIAFNCFCSGPGVNRSFWFSNGNAMGTFQVGPGGKCFSPLLLRGGSGYTTTPSVVLPYDCGQAVNVTVVMASGGGGVGCIAPVGQLLFFGGGGFGAAGYYTAQNGAVSSLIITSRGSMYSSPPQAILSDGACALYDLIAILSLPVPHTRRILSVSKQRLITVASSFSFTPSSSYSYRIDSPTVVSSQIMTTGASSNQIFCGCTACNLCPPCKSCNASCDSNDKIPLRIHSPSFITKNFGQSTPWPGATNTLSFTISTNMNLYGDGITSFVLTSSLDGTTASGLLSNLFVSPNSALVVSPSGLVPGDTILVEKELIQVSNQGCTLNFCSVIRGVRGSNVAFHNTGAIATLVKRSISNITLNSNLIALNDNVNTTALFSGIQPILPLMSGDLIIVGSSGEVIRILSGSCTSVCTVARAQHTPSGVNTVASAVLSASPITLIQRGTQFKDPQKIIIKGLAGDCWYSDSLTTFTLTSALDLVSSVVYLTADTSYQISSVLPNDLLLIGTEVIQVISACNMSSCVVSRGTQGTTSGFAQQGTKASLIQRVYGGKSPGTVIFVTSAAFSSTATSIYLNSTNVSASTFSLLKNDLLLLTGFSGGEILRIRSPCTSVCSVERGYPTPAGETTWPGGMGGVTVAAGSQVIFVRRPGTLAPGNLMFPIQESLNSSSNVVKLKDNNPTGYSLSALTDGDTLEIQGEIVRVTGVCTLSGTNNFACPIERQQAGTTSSQFSVQGTLASVNRPPCSFTDVALRDLSDMGSDVCLPVKNGASSFLRSAATWNNVSKTLVLAVADAGFVSGTLHMFSVSFINPLAPRSTSTFTISATKPGGCSQLLPECTMQVPSAADLQPLTVQCPSFTVGTIVQSSPLPCMLNTFSVTFASNVALPPFSRITLSGLIGSSSADSPALALIWQKKTQQYANMSTVSDPFSFLLPTASWSKSDGLLVTFLSGDSPQLSTLPGTLYSFGFVLKNPASAQTARTVTISSDGLGPFVLSSPSVSALVNGDQLPLAVRDQTVNAFISQQTSAPGAVNSITVAISTGVSNTSNLNSITLGPFNGAIATPGPIALHGVSGVQDNANIFMHGPRGIPGTGLWNDTSASLILFLSPFIAPSVLNATFSFFITNPSCGQICSNVTLLVAKQNSCASDSSVGTCPNSIVGSVLLDVSDRCPMKVQVPGFSVAVISESNSVPFCSNVLTVTLASNVPLGVGSVITIDGLTGTGTSASFLDISGPDSALLSGITWNQASGTLMANVIFAKGIAAQQRITFSFEILNPGVPQRPIQPLLGAFHTGGVKMGLSTMLGSVLGAGSSAQVTQASVIETSVIQGSWNTLLFTFSINILLPQNSLFSITGLFGTQSSSIPSKLGGKDAGTFSVSSWNPANGTLILVTSSKLPAGYRFSFTIEVLNGLAPQPAPTGISISVSSAASTCCFPNGFLLPTFHVSGSILSFSGVPNFVTANIGKSSAYPGDLSIITMTLVPNFDFYSANNTALSVSISGLQGGTASTGFLALSGSNVFSAGCWSCGCGSSCANSSQTSPLGILTMQVVNDMLAGSQYVVSFRLGNPLTTTSASISVSSSWNGKQFTQPKFVQNDISSLPSGIFLPTPGDAALFSVRSIQLTQNSIMQGSAYPCSVNLICATLQANIPLPNASVITLSTFTNAIPIFSGIPASSAVPPQSTSILSSQSVSQLSGSWIASSSALQLTFGCTVDAGQIITICFSVQNPPQGQSPASISVSFNLYGSSFVKLMDSSALPQNRPMFVTNPSFTSLLIQQSSPWPCDSQNILTVALTLNVPLFPCCAATISIQGLATTQSFLGPTNPSGVLNLTDLSNVGNQGKFGQQAYWNPTFGSLVFTVQNTTAVGTIYTLQVAVANPAPASDQISTMIYGSALSSAAASAFQANLGAGDAAPLRVYAPRFTIKSIYQSTAWPTATNFVTVTIQANTDLNSGSTVTISGLSSSSFPAPLEVGNTRAGVSCGLSQNSSASGIFILFSSWMPIFQQNRFLLAENIANRAADNFVCVRFNGLSSSWEYFSGISWVSFVAVPSDILVASVYKPANLSCQLATLTSLDCTVFNGTYNGIVIGFKSVPGCAKVKFSNRQLLSDLDVVISGSFIYTFSVSLYSTSSAFLSSIVSTSPALIGFAQVVTGNLVLTVQQNKTISKNSISVFSFKIMNSATQATITASIAANTICTVLPMTNMDGVLNVVSPAFTALKAGQSSPFPCAKNTITVTLQTNVHLRLCDLSNITISGLDGAIVNTSMVSLVDASGGEPNSLLFASSAATWVDSSKSLIIQVASDILAGQEYKFSFQIRNPVVSPDPINVGKILPPSDTVTPKISMWAAPSVSVITSGTAVISGFPTPPSSPLNLCGASTYVQDGAPLYLYQPTFLLKAIGQSSNYPCQNNTLTITLKTNTPLCGGDCNIRITLSNLIGAVPSNIASDGSFQILSTTTNISSPFYGQHALFFLVGTELFQGPHHGTVYRAV